MAPSKFYERLRPWSLSRVGGLLPVLAALVLLLLWLHRGHALDWDELEFARAATWVRQGKVPYRDFWEHHTSLQWFLAAPFAGHFKGVDGILLLRWIQLFQWLLAFWVVKASMDREDLRGASRWASLALLLASPFFFMQALEFRVDVLATVFMAWGLGLWAWPARTPWRLALAGACFSLAILANLRMGPMAGFALALTLVLDPLRRRWGFCSHGLAAFGGALATGALALAYLGATHAFAAFWTHVITENYWAGMALIRTGGPGLVRRLAEGPLAQLDLAGGVYLALAGLGSLLALRDFRRPGWLQLTLLVQALHLTATLRMGVIYVYHFQTTLFLALPFAALALQWLGGLFTAPEARRRWSATLLCGAWLAVGLDGYDLAFRSTGPTLRYQDRIMREVEARTLPGETVLDGCAFAPHREPAYRYWFLPLLVRILVLDHRMEPYTPAQAKANPPAALVFNIRLFNWFSEHPDLALHFTTHYLPVTPHLWLPGPSGVMGPGAAERTWTVPRSGTYRLTASTGLARHPWFQNPLSIIGLARDNLPGVGIRPEDLPKGMPEGLEATLDGVPLQAGAGPVTLVKGGVLRLGYAGKDPIGVMCLPTGVERWFQGPPEGSGIDGQFILKRVSDDGS